MTTNPPFKTLAANRAVRILGVTVNPLTLKELNTLVSRAIESQQCWIIANHNLHSLYLYHHLPKMRQFYDVAEYSHCDGMSLVFLGKLLGLPLRREHRVTFVDWIDPLMAEAAQQGWRVFYLGSKPGIADKGSEILRLKFPQLQIQSAHG